MYHVFNASIVIGVTFTVSRLLPQAAESVAEEKVHSKEWLFDHLAWDGM